MGPVAPPGTSVALADLPGIADVLALGDRPTFVVLDYAAFVRFAAMADAVAPPDVTAVLDRGDEHSFVVIPYDAYQAYLARLHVTGSIDERHYLAKHPDVAQAVAAGQLPDGTHHYTVQGYFERREMRLRPAHGPVKQS